MEIQEGKCLFVGKIVDVSRVSLDRRSSQVTHDDEKHFIQEVRGGFTWGQVRIKKLREDEVEYLPNLVVDKNLSDAADDDPTVIIPFQNENLCAYMELQDGTRTVNSFFLLVLNR